MAIEHRDRAVAHGDNVKPLYSTFGDPVTGKMLVNAPGDDNSISAAGVFSTAPYTGGEKTPVKAEEKIAKLCAWEEYACRGYATRTGFCAGHSKAMKKAE